ncbi:MAG: methylglyoxal synthase, partial [Pseudomonadota bacterium]
KEALLRWCSKHIETLKRHQLIGTGTSAGLISQRIGLPVKALISGPMGGDQQLGGLIAEQKVHTLVFFWDPLEPTPHDPDVKALLRLASVWNIPVANNEATADMLVSSSYFNIEMDWEVPDYQAYIAGRQQG